MFSGCSAGYGYTCDSGCRLVTGQVIRKVSFKCLQDGYPNPDACCHDRRVVRIAQMQNCAEHSCNQRCAASFGGSCTLLSKISCIPSSNTAAVRTFWCKPHHDDSMQLYVYELPTCTAELCQHNCCFGMTWPLHRDVCPHYSNQLYMYEASPCCCSSFAGYQSGCSRTLRCAFVTAGLMLHSRAAYILLLSCSKATNDSQSAAP
jgi:hypothetical protein